LSISKDPLASTSSSWARSGKPSRIAEQFLVPGPAQDLHIARPARRAEWPEPRKVVATLRGWRNGEAADARQMKCLALAGLPRVLAEPDADPVAVAPDGIEQQCEVTIKEGMLDETILIMVVDKSATPTALSLGSSDADDGPNPAQQKAAPQLDDDRLLIDDDLLDELVNELCSFSR
jgi:hypothetical protein